MFIFRAFKRRYFGPIFCPPRENYVQEYRYVRVRALGHGAMSGLITLFFMQFFPGSYTLYLPISLPMVWKLFCFIKDFVILRKSINVVDYFFDFWEWAVLGYGIVLIFGGL